MRVARNAEHVRATFEAALGFPIEVISGREEARLIYQGAAHAMAQDDADRLVFDIGGGSTECILGRNYEALALESATVGCVSVSARHFPSGEVGRERFEHARLSARAALAPFSLSYRRRGWQYAVGTSGTAKALCQAAASVLGSPRLTREALSEMTELLLRAGHVDRLRIEGLKADRRPVLGGGLAVMNAVFDEFDLQAIDYCPGALRQGVLYDLLGRRHGQDQREITVSRMARSYGCDLAHGERVQATAIALFMQAARSADEDLSRRRRLLGWAAQLAEVGMTISHEDFHKHSAYVLTHADMPGFSQAEQRSLAHLALSQTGGLRKLGPLLGDPLDWLMALSLRLAVILHRRRDAEPVVTPALFHKRGRVRIEMPSGWARSHPLTDDSLAEEARLWRDAGVFEDVSYETI
jgi:exopolyphosphatase/guanosine-5'-triphosphate,3'-diphosphate pyrophosphatase